MREQLNSKNRKKRKWLWITLSILGVLLIGISAYVYSIYSSVEQAASQMYEQPTREVSEKRIEKVEYTEKDPISILIMGVDERTGDIGRSDTMIVITVNPTTQSMKMVSIPRDTRTEMVGKGTQDKINHAYAFGGTDMAVATVENFLDIPIDHYIKVNMESFQEIVDAVGGVTVTNPFSFTEAGYTFQEGEITLNGAQALAYSRMRYKDPRGDFGRQDRQKQIILGIIQKGASFSSINKFDDVLTILGGNVKTDLSFDQMVDIQANYKEARHSLEQLQIKGSGEKINGIYYYTVPEDEQVKLSTTLREHLELK
ncbi:LCP family protein required for cell wall assembly [Bacillus mesophilus]|uniref:Polyisoprenyl-teichoic acid--peptidoglycan teichoic acid transferase TagU n=1 Tax=Bacillus mesophilus TaxID=1808955 RepID=A0A6M0Q808_9BACI|nr:LytR family transcriptional regulator [Bacillus mesophilus]MBM7661745.1 LCP family protein required for cell wall assembly [Bacillus mesophilus]NEY72403.1 LytR family transcriptional regulator [Bacillus mesophilus]